MSKDDQSRFVFNQNGMCQNPEKIEIYRRGKDYAIVEVAQSPDGTWCEGYDYNCYNAGGGATPGFNQYRKKYRSRQEAFEKALQRFIASAQRYEKYPDNEGLANRKFKEAIQLYIVKNGMSPTLMDPEPRVGRHGQFKLFFA